MLIPLVHGEPIRFGAESEKGVMMGNDGRRPHRRRGRGRRGRPPGARRDRRPGLAFQLSRLSHGPYEPTPIGVFRSVERPEYAEMVGEQLIAANDAKGPGDLQSLLYSGATWTVE